MGTAVKRLLSLCGAALAVAACGTPTPAGLRIDLSLNGITIDTLKISVSASPGGFAVAAGSGVPGVTLSNETDGNGLPALVLLFKSPDYVFPPTVSFRLDTANQAELTMTASALAFKAGALVADAPSSAGVTLPAGGAATLELALGAKTGLIAPDTKTTDLAGDAAAVAVLGAQPAGPGGAPPLSSVAICDLDGDGNGDLVVGGSEVDDNLLTAAGAVYVVFGTTAWAPGSATTIDVANPGTNTVLTVRGENSADRFGASVACLDVDKDGAADLIVGAPGAGNGAGEIYLFYGRQNIATKAPTPTPATADVRWTSSAGNAALGTDLFVGDLDGDGKAEILAAAPGTQTVHLFTKFTAGTTTTFDVEAAGHARFTGIVPTALGAGDLNLDGAPDVVLGDTEFRPAGAANKTGVVYVFAGVDLTGATAYPLGSQSKTIVGPEQSQLGAAVLALDTTGTGADLVVGAPGDGAGTGKVFLFTADGDFFAAATADTTAVRYSLAGPEVGGRFGSAMAAAYTGPRNTGSANLIVGAPATGRGGARQMAGAAYFFGHGTSRSFPLLDQVYGKAANDQLGTALAGGEINAGLPLGDLIPDFATLAPGANAGAGAAYAILGH